MPLGDARLAFIEAKAARTVHPVAGESIDRLRQARARYEAEGMVVHRPIGAAAHIRALRPGARAIGLTDLLDALARPRGDPRHG